MATLTILALSTTEATHTGDTTETILGTYTLPANTIPADGILRISPLWAKGGTSSSYLGRVRFNGISGTIYSSQSISSAATSFGSGLATLWTNNATNAQKGSGQAVPGAGSPLITSAVDTTNNVDIIFTAQLNNAADTAKLEGYLIELIA